MPLKKVIQAFLFHIFKRNCSNFRIIGNDHSIIPVYSCSKSPKPTIIQLNLICRAIEQIQLGIKLPVLAAFPVRNYLDDVFCINDFSTSPNLLYEIKKSTK